METRRAKQVDKAEQDLTTNLFWVFRERKLGMDFCGSMLLHVRHKDSELLDLPGTACRDFVDTVGVWPLQRHSRDCSPCRVAARCLQVSESVELFLSV